MAYQCVVQHRLVQTCHHDHALTHNNAVVHNSICGTASACLSLLQACLMLLEKQTHFVADHHDGQACPSRLTCAQATAQSPLLQMNGTGNGCIKRISICATGGMFCWAAWHASDAAAAAWLWLPAHQCPPASTCSPAAHSSNTKVISASQPRTMMIYH